MAETAAVATPTPEGGAQPKVEDPKPQVQEAIDPTSGKPAEAKPKEEAPPAPRFYTRKVNGKEEQIPAEAIDAAAKALGLEPTEILSASQLKRAAYQKFEEAEKARKEVESLRGIKDPWKLAQQMAGLDDAALDKLAEERLIAKLQREAMAPEQRQLLEERERLAKERAEVEAAKKAHAEAQMTAQANAVRERMEPMIIDAIEKAGLPKTPDAVRAVVNELQKQHRFNLPLDVDAAVRDARGGFVQPTVAMLSKMPVEKLVELLGQEAVNGILRHSIAQKAGPQTVPAKPVENPAQGKPERYFMTPRELDALAEARVRALK